MKKEAYRSTFPFANDGKLTPAPFGGNSPLSSLDRDYDRRLGLPSGSHMFTGENDIDGVNPQLPPIFEGEFDMTGIDHPNAKGFAIITDDGKRIVVKNRDINYVLKKIKEENIKYRYLQAIVACESKKMIKEASESDRFVPTVASLLASCFKIESESYKNRVKEIGSCFYIKENYMLTCAHVISRRRETDLSNTAVFLIDGSKRFFCQVIDLDYDLDIALLYCDAVKHHPLKIKNVESVNVGEEIICVGSPYGYDNNVTMGILSSKDRFVKTEKIPYFFMDLSVFPGSSGGPIIDSGDGKVFGLAAMIVESVANYGLNAGIPIDVCIKRFSKIFSSGEK